MIVCVCTGNTCRSPMAAALLRRELDRVGRPDVQVESAGLAADGSPATPQAVEVMAEWGIDIAAHRSRPLTAELLQQADAVLVMTPAHRQVLLSVGMPADRVLVPDPPIPDPYGGDVELYRPTRDALQAAVQALAATLAPVTVRPLQAKDAPALAAIEAACFAHPWSEAALRDEVDNPAAFFVVATRAEQPVGYAGMHIAADEGFLDNVAVAPASRRGGVASALLDVLLAEGRARGLSRLTLEVRPSNAAALALYEKKGFTRDGVRPGFYRDPAEDAAIYSYYYAKEREV